MVSLSFIGKILRLLLTNPSHLFPMFIVYLRTCFFYQLDTASSSLSGKRANLLCIARKMKFSVKNLFSKLFFLQIYSHLLRKLCKWSLRKQTDFRVLREITGKSLTSARFHANRSYKLLRYRACTSHKSLRYRAYRSHKSLCCHTCTSHKSLLPCFWISS